ncbi:hypothetical protein C8E97_5698 [Saccharothrix australiensis]|uniref:Uncharacterized protein n=1 Tax=Saccharothrix australiensis TaxID=2072 RepID=A0A495W6T4_9PSEU|nr:hypothetical protein C8E97_5698 [Saccharothrix australiensis]
MARHAAASPAPAGSSCSRRHRGAGRCAFRARRSVARVPDAAPRAGRWPPCRLPALCGAAARPAGAAPRRRVDRRARPALVPPGGERHGEAADPARGSLRLRRSPGRAGRDRRSAPGEHPGGRRSGLRCRPRYGPGARLGRGRFGWPNARRARRSRPIGDHDPPPAPPAAVPPRRTAPAPNGHRARERPPCPRRTATAPAPVGRRACARPPTGRERGHVRWPRRWSGPCRPVARDPVRASAARSGRGTAPTRPRTRPPDSITQVRPVPPGGHPPPARPARPDRRAPRRPAARGVGRRPRAGPGVTALARAAVAGDLEPAGRGATMPWL